MLKYFKTWKFRFDAAGRARLLHGALQAIASVGVLTIALYLAIESRVAARAGQPHLAIPLALAALSLAATAAWIIIPRLARRIDFGFLRLPFSFRVTRAGLIYIIAVFLLSLAAVNTGNNLLFLILALQIAAIVTSGIFARASLRAISVSMDVPENVFVGELVSIRISLQNRKRFLPSLSLLVEDAAAEKRSRKGRPKGPAISVAYPPEHAILRHPAYFPVLMPKEWKSELVVQSFPVRGRYRLEGFKASTRFPFGLFHRGERIRAEGEVLVYPKIQEVSSYFHLLPFQAGRYEGRQIGPGESLHAILKYREGQSVRWIDWKATAKVGQTMAREFSRDEEFRFCLILDTVLRSGDEADSKRFEDAVSLTASLAAHFSEEGAEVEFLTPEEHLPRRSGSDQLFRILRSLAVVGPRSATGRETGDFRSDLAGALSQAGLQEILSEKVFKIIVTSKPRGSFPASIWRSSHVIYFDEL